MTTRHAQACRSTLCRRHLRAKCLAGNTALKAIVVMGIATFVLLMLVSFGLRRGLQTNERQRVRILQKYSAFDEHRAYKDLEAMVTLGPRPAGSPALKQARSYVVQELKAVGFTVREQTFTGVTSSGPAELVNVLATSKGTTPGTILLLTHYDTKHLENASFVGANDNAAANAWLLESARMLGPERTGVDVCFAWLDGAESLDADAHAAQQGSRALLRDYTSLGLESPIIAVLAFTAIGDCYLSLTKDADAPDVLRDIIWETGRRLGYGRHFGNSQQKLIEDNVCFREAGIPAIAIVDTSFGGSPLRHKSLWHTAADAPETVCPESLRALGDVIYHALPAIEGNIQALGNQ